MYVKLSCKIYIYYIFDAELFLSIGNYLSCACIT